MLILRGKIKVKIDCQKIKIPKIIKQIILKRGLLFLYMLYIMNHLMYYMNITKILKGKRLFFAFKNKDSVL